MDAERWQRVERLLDAALELSAEERETLLIRECNNDPGLADEVRAILRIGQQGGSILDTPAPHLGAALIATDPDPTPAPTRVGPWRVERLIGEGGMGSVYLARRDDGSFDQRVAVKVIRRGLQMDSRVIRRFREERQILAGLSHPGIVPLLDGGLTDDRLPYLAMEYVEGLPITRYCDAHGLGVAERLELFARVCDAVAHAHGKLIVHRDLKPSNILVTEAGDLRLLDFGIAKLLDTTPAATEATERSERLLTPEYASPEQIRGEAVVVGSDVYALGVLLYELLAGRRPFVKAGRTAHELERAVLEDEPTRPSAVAEGEPVRRQLRGDLDAIVLMAMRKEPSQRYPSAAELAADLARYLGGDPVAARGSSHVERMGRWARRHRVGLSSTAAALVGAGIILAITLPRSTAPGGDGLGTLRLDAPQHVTGDEGLELDPAISPDGTRVAYAAGDYGAMRIFVRQRDGSRAVPLSGSLGGSHRWPRWSPDGTRVLFLAERGLWLVPALGGSPELVVAPPSDTASAHSPAWSPDGSEIAWVTRDTVFARAIRGNRPRVVAAVPVTHSLDWSPDGRWIVLVSGNAEFVHHRLGNLGPSALFLAPARCERSSCAPFRIVAPTSLNTSPAWLDPSRLVFISNRGGPRDLYALRINGSGAAPHEPVPLSAGQDMHGVSAASDGRTLAYSVFRQTSNIWALDITDGPRKFSDAVRITTGRQTVEGLDLSPDGEWIAFDANRTGTQDIYLVSSAGGEVERVISTSEDKFHPAWSPDGSQLAFHTFHDGVRRAATAPSRGGAARLIRPEGPAIEEHTPVWTRDGQGLVYFRILTGGADLYLVRRTGDSSWSPERQLTTRGGLWPSFSADGRRMAYIPTPGVVRMMGADLNEASSRIVLDVSSQGSGGVFAETSVLARDGATVYVKGYDGRGPGFWSLPADGGRPRLLARLDDARLSSPRPEFTTDGRRIFFLVAEREADVWAVRLEERPR